MVYLSNKYIYLLWIINFIIHIYSIFGMNAWTTFITNILTLFYKYIVIFGYLLLVVILSIFLHISILGFRLPINEWIYSVWKHYLYIIPNANSRRRSRRRRNQISLFNLPKFTSFIPFRYFHINWTTPVKSLDEFIYETHKTNRYTLVLSTSLNIQERFIQIEYIYETKSLLLVFDLSQNLST